MSAVAVYCIDYDGCGMAGQWPAVLHCGHRCTRPSHLQPQLSTTDAIHNHTAHSTSSRPDTAQKQCNKLLLSYHVSCMTTYSGFISFIILSSTDCKSTIWRQFEIGSPLLIYTRPNDWIARWSLNFHHRSSLPVPNLCSFNLRIWYQYETVFLVSGV